MNDNTKLDKFYTKNNIVELCTTNINNVLNIDYKKDLVIEPSVGNGSFINSINKLCKNKIFIELDRSHEQSLYNKYKFKKNELIFLDYLDFDYYNIKNIYNNIHVVGNPPFGTKSSQAIKFIKHSCKFCDSFSFILPKSFKKDSLIEKIPENLTLDLEGIDIGESFKISSVKLDPDVTPTIQGRDFVIATLAAPTVMKEPEKPAEAEAAEGEDGAEAAETSAADGDKAPAEAAKGDKKEGDEKKSTDKKPAEEKK